MYNITASGNLGKDVEKRTTKGGHTVYSTTVAVYAGKDGENKISKWYELTAWGKFGEKMEDYKKGDYIYFSGEAGARSWNDKLYDTCNLQSIEKVEAGRTKQPQQTQEQTVTSELPDVNIDDIDVKLPF